MKFDLLVVWPQLLATVQWYLLDKYLQVNRASDWLGEINYDSFRVQPFQIIFLTNLPKYHSDYLG